MKFRSAGAKARHDYGAAQVANLTEQDLEEGRRLVAAGYTQTSRKFRSVARLPPGMTGLQALQQHRPEEYRRVMQQAEQMAADSYRRRPQPEDEKTLSIAHFAAFRKAGGSFSY